MVRRYSHYHIFHSPTEVFRRVRQFVATRACRDGGYTFAKNAPATLADTYFAIKTLNLLGYRRFSAIHARFVINEYYRARERLTMENYFRVLWLLRLFGKKIPKLTLQRQIGRLEDDYWYARCQDMVRGRIIMPRAFIVGIRHKNLQRFKYLPSAVKLVWFKQKFGSMKRSEFIEAIHFFQSFQNGDGGFGLRQNTTSYLDWVYQGIVGLSSLQSYPADVRGCINFILGSQVNNGGFGRNYATVPSLENTYQAVACLKYILNRTNYNSLFI